MLTPVEIKGLLPDVKLYLGRSNNKSDNMIEDLIATADALICGGVSPNYDIEDPRAKLLIKAIVFDLYHNRGTDVDLKTKGTVQRMIETLKFQLRCEMLP